MKKSPTEEVFSAIFAFYIFPMIACGLMAKLHNYMLEGTTEPKFPGELILLPGFNIIASFTLAVMNILHFLKITVIYWINN